MAHPCPDCEETVECGCDHPDARPPCSACTDHVCYAEHDVERREEIEFDITDARNAPAGAKLNTTKMLCDLEWLCERLEVLSGG